MTGHLDSSPRSVGDGARARAYYWDFWPSMIGYGVVLSAVLAWGHLNGTNPWRYLWVLPMTPALGIVRAMLRHIRRIDDYQAASAAAGTGRRLRDRDDRIPDGRVPGHRRAPDALRRVDHLRHRDARVDSGEPARAEAVNNQLKTLRQAQGWSQGRPGRPAGRVPADRERPGNRSVRPQPDARLPDRPTVRPTHRRHLPPRQPAQHRRRLTPERGGPVDDPLPALLEPSGPQESGSARRTSQRRSGMRARRASAVTSAQSKVSATAR